MRTRFKTIWTYLCFMLAVTSIAACGNPSAYNPEKAALLTEAQLREMDIALYNDLYNKGNYTIRCDVKAEDIYDCNHDFYQSLAAQGHEVAGIIAQLHRRHELLRADREVFERLHTLAKQGDPSALCFVGRVFTMIDRERKKAWGYDYHKDFEPFTEKGAALKLPVCVQYYAFGLREVYGAEYPDHVAVPLVNQKFAAKAGIYAAFQELAYYYEYIGVSDQDAPMYAYKNSDISMDEYIELMRIQLESKTPYVHKDKMHSLKNTEIALCWARLANLTKHGHLSGLISKISLVAHDDNYQLIHPEYMDLIKAWDLRTSPYETNPTKPQDCIDLEEEQ